MNEVETAPAPARRRWLLPALLGVALAPFAAFAAAEGVCRVLDGNSFPHLNIYLPDATLGVRLRPNASQRLGFAGNAVTTVRTNSMGFRGGEWPAPSEGGDVLVVGDSQVFGLGVEENETHAAVMGEKLGRTVINGGVPTYGPAEYAAVIREIGAQRKLAEVVVVYNAVNDFFEVSRPNSQRHVVADGWAVRTELAPDLTPFFGRQWLYNQSHAVLAWRKRANAADEVRAHLDEAGVPSEGSAGDLTPLGPQSAQVARPVQGSVAAEEQSLQQGVLDALEASRNSDAEMRMLGAMAYIADPDRNDDDEFSLSAAIAKKKPGDRIMRAYVEESRSVEVTAEMLERGARLRAELPQKLRRWLREHPDGEEWVRREVGDALADWDLSQGRGGVRADHVAAVAPTTSALHEGLLAAKAAADQVGAKLTVVVLPMDVQVSPEEWAKYGAPARDMTGSLGLLTEAAREADELGARVVLPLDALRAAEPGAFLKGDIHLTVKGQRVLGEAIAAAVVGPPPVPVPGSGLPEGRSRVPLDEEWLAVRETVVKGSTAANCGTWQVREWLKVECRGENPEGVAIVAAPRETIVNRTPGVLTLVTPQLDGRPIQADFRFANASWSLTVDGAGRRIEATAAPNSPTALDTRCAAPTSGPAWEGTLGPGCEQFSDCAELRACAEGRRTAPPTCDVGESIAGSTGWCFARCSEAVPCATGVCTPWQGSAVCL
jgi:hypothetical protein